MTRGLLPASFLAILGVFAVVAMFLWVAPEFTLGGITVDDPTAFIPLTSSADSLTSGNYDTFESPRGSDFQVPDGKTLYIIHLEGVPVNGAGGERITIGYSTNTVDNGTIPVGAVIVSNFTFEEATTQDVHGNIWAPIPSGMFPFLGIVGSGSVQATGLLR